MAHVKVTRRSMRPEEWTALRYGWLKRGMYAEEWEIQNLEIRDARQISESEYAEWTPWRALKRGDLYFTPDGTAFIRAHVVIPENLRGKPLVFRLHTAAEMIVKINGRYAGGIDPNREYFELTGVENEFDLDIEGYNRSKPDDERAPAVMAIRGCRQVFEGAYLAVIREDVRSLLYDCTLLEDIAGSEYFNEDYRKMVNIELSRALDLVDFDTFEGAAEAGRYIEEHIYANHDWRGSGDVALVGHSHLDIAYYWRRCHSVQKNARTILIQMRLMDRYPELKYVHTQPYVFETLEKYYPELMAELKEKVARGQFEVAGAMYVEPDCNLPSAESLIRQCLYGQEVYQRLFGKRVDNAWLPDVFGNSWVLPQILKGCGVDYFVSNKMSTWNDTNRFPHNNFIWRGIDGSEVYACVPPTHFITWNMPSQIQENWEAYQDKGNGGQTLNMFGYGDGGSGCTEEMLEMYRRFEKVSVMPKTEIIGGAEFLKKNLKDNPNLAVWDGELYLEMHRGTFTTKSALKMRNRKLEFMFREAEIRRSMAYLSGMEYPAEELKALYKKFLINQFHDILPGSHIHPVYEDAMADYDEIEAGLEKMIRETEDAEGVFNSLNFTRTAPVFMPSPEGADVRHGEKGSWGMPEAEGLKNGTVREMPTGAFEAVETADGLRVVTPIYEAEILPDGSFKYLYDRELRREWTREGHGFNRLHLYADHPGMYDAWDILPNYKDVEIALETAGKPEVIFADDTMCEVAVTLRTEKSEWRMVIRFFAAFRGIEVENIVSWHEKHRLMKVNFGADLLRRSLICDTGAGYIERERNKNTTWQQARFEVCQHKWCEMEETGAGLAIINEGKYGVGLEGDEISLSLLRAIIRPDITSDMGDHDFCYMIYPHEGDLVSSGVNRLALEYNVPLRGAMRSAAEMPDFGNLYLQAMKLSEDGSGIIVRLSEQDGRRGEISPGKVVRTNMLEDEAEETDRVVYRPFEIVTLKMK